MTWANRWTFARGRKSTPALERRTTVNMVPIVTIPKTLVTTTRPKRLFCAAGYIRIGINGSHGPKTKMTNSVQGAMLEPALLS